MKIVGIMFLIAIILFIVAKISINKEHKAQEDRERWAKERRQQELNNQRESLKNDEEKQKELIREYSHHIGVSSEHRLKGYEWAIKIADDERKKALDLAYILRPIVTQETKDEVAKSFNGYHQDISKYTFDVDRDLQIYYQYTHPNGLTAAEQGRILQNVADSLKYKPTNAPSQKEKSVVGSAVAGGIIAGPAGAVVGAIHAADKNNKMRAEKK